jgi:hypothetical protein
MARDFYQFSLSDRRRFLADTGFGRDDLRIWSHPDGRIIGESVAAALTDEAFFRYLKIATPKTEEVEDGIVDETVAEIGNLRQ